MNTFFSDKIILWRKMTKIWLKIWLKVKENGTKKNQIGENGGERKKNPSAKPVFFFFCFCFLIFRLKYFCIYSAANQQNDA